MSASLMTKPIFYLGYKKNIYISQIHHSSCSDMHISSLLLKQSSGLYDKYNYY